MATYLITSQADLENLPTLTSQDTVQLSNDVALSNWTTMGRTWTGATFDGRGYKFTGLDTLSGNAIKEGTDTGYGSNINVASSYSIGTVHTIAFTVQVVTGTSYSFYVFGSNDESYGSVRLGNNNALVYRCGTGGASTTTQNWTISSPATSKRRYVVVRNGTSVTLYQDGVSLGAKTLSSNYAFSRCDDIARNASGTWGAWLKELIITTDVKDAAWVLQDYNGGLHRYTTTSNTPNLANAWHGLEGTGTTLADSVGGKNGTGVDGWATFETRAGLMRSVTSGTIKNIIIENPTVSNTTTADYGVLMNNASACTVDGCAVIGGSTYNGYNSSNATFGGLIGAAQNSTVKNCYVSLDSMSSITACRSGGLIGMVMTVELMRTTIPLVGQQTHLSMGCLGYISAGGTIRNNWSAMTATVKELFATPDTSGTFTNNYFHDLGLGETRGTGIADETDFYNITQAPMTSWDFTPTGYWSTVNDGTDYPIYQTHYSDDISGSVGSYTDGKTITLSVPNKVYCVKDMQSGTAYGKFATVPTIGTLHTIAFTLEIDGYVTIIRKISTCDVGLFILNGNQWKYGAGNWLTNQH
jgi:hypothetical protein